MPRHSYKTALRVKGIKPIPPYHKLRSSQSPDDQHITSQPEKPKVPRWFFGGCYYAANRYYEGFE